MHGHDLAELDGGPIHHESSIWSLLEEAHDKDPEKLAIAAMHQPPTHLEDLAGQGSRPDTQHLAWSYSQLMRGAYRIASALEACGVSRQSTLVTFLPNSAEWCLLLWAAALMKLTFVPLDRGMLSEARSDELEYLIQTLKPAAIVVFDKAGAEIIDQTQQRTSTSSKIRWCIDTGSVRLPPLWTSLSSARTGSPARSRDYSVPCSEVEMQRTAAIIFTSGTSTGRPKGCPHTEKALVTFMLANPVHGLDRDCTSIVQSANFRAICLSLTLTTWSVGATAVMSGDTFEPETILNALDTYERSLMICVPTKVHAIRADPT